MSGVNYRKILVIITFTVLLFISALEDLTGIGFVDFLFQHIDEFMVMALTFYVLINIRVCIKEKMDLVVIWLMFMCTGAFSSIMYGYQGIVPTLMDALLIVNKFMIGYLSVIIYLRKTNAHISDYIDGAARVITTIIFICGVHDIFFEPWFSPSDFKYFTYSLRLMFFHPTYLAAAMATLMILLGYKNDHNRNIVFMLMASFIGIMTFRGKAIGFFFVYWLMYILIVVLRSKKYLSVIGVGAIVAVILAREKIYVYFLGGNVYQPRLILLKDGIKLMLEHFPLGTGFATFGSIIATNYYSPLYEKLGYLEIYGLNKEFSGYLSDSFWPIIFAQFGLIGTIFFVWVVIYFFRKTVKMLKKDKLAGFAMLMTLVYMLISSTAESAFFNPVAFLFFMLFAVYEKEERTANKESGRLEQTR
ncbi:MAG: O-antigen ligase family protein [Lachnospira sp.]